MNGKNIVFIGMPGSGKSTLGVLLAKHLGMAFLDTDLVIQQREGRLLQSIIDQDGVAEFLQIEAAVVQQIRVVDTVIATGGSVIYSASAIEQLRRDGILVYLQLSYPAIEQRIQNMASRGIALAEGQQLVDLYYERIPLYEANADLTVPCDGLSVDELVFKISDLLKPLLASQDPTRS
jgi:shikimate kinase